MREGDPALPGPDVDHLVRVFDEIDEIVMVTRLGVGLVYLNRAAEQIVPPNSLGRLLIDCAKPPLRDFLLRSVTPELNEHRRWEGDVEIDRDGRSRIYATTASPVGIDDDDVYVGVIMRDVTAERTSAEALSRQTRQDTLTGLPNRLALMEHLERCRTSGPGNEYVTVCFVDLDNLKVVNDGLGHAAGDLLLCAVGDVLEAPADGLVARFAGDEFVVVYDDLGPDEVSAVTDALLMAVASVDVPGVSSHVSASIGVATCRRADLEPDRLISDADAAMYVAKRSGRAQAAVFDDGIRASTARRFHLESSLRTALAAETLEIALQPVIALATDQVSGFEALARWDVTDPGEFIPLAEEAGLIGPLGRWALNRALRAAAQIQEADPALAGLNVGVNVSALQLIDPGFPDFVLECLSIHGVRPQRLVLELTETALIDPRTDTSRLLNRLHDAGVTLALDDFGSGFSSLGYLRRYPIDVLKLDNSYTQALENDPETRIIVESVMTMAQRLGIRVVAEGVETEDQLRAVRELGVDWAQGYLLGHPAPVDDLLARLTTTP